MLSAELSILVPAFLAGLLVLATHVPLGRLVLERGIVFIDLAIAQVAGLGVVAASVMGWEPQGWSVQFSAAIAALLAAIGLLWSERRIPAVQEAVIGVVFVVSASAELILLSFNPHGAEHLKDLLVGQILWVEPRQLLPVAVLYAGVLVVFAAFNLRRQRALFYLLFAVTITASVQLVGIYLVFASLILPALASTGITARTGLVIGYATGLAGYVLGLVGSALSDVPTGAAIVCGLALTAALIGMLRAVHRSRGTPLACLVTALVTMLVGACAGVPPGLEKEGARTEAAHWDFDMCIQAHVRNPSACSAARAAYDRALKEYRAAASSQQR